MTPSQLDKQEKDRQDIINSYVPAYNTAKITTDYNTYNKLLQEAVNYINAKYPNGIPGSNPVQPLAYYDKDKDDFVLHVNYMSGGRDDKLEEAIKTLKNYKSGISHTIKETYFPKAAVKDETNISKRISKLSELLSCSAKASTSKTDPLKWRISVSFSGSEYSPAGMVSIREILSGCRQSCSILAAVLSAVRLSVRTPKNTICLYFLNSLSRNLYTERFL